MTFLHKLPRHIIDVDSRKGKRGGSFHTFSDRESRMRPLPLRRSKWHVNEDRGLFVNLANARHIIRNLNDLL